MRKRGVWVWGVCIVLSSCGDAASPGSATNEGLEPECAPSCRWACVDGACDEPVWVTVGAAHSCALRASGAVECWGANDHGQLGDGTTIARPSASSIVVEGAVSIDAGDDHTCALLDDGGVACWGANESGQLGDGTSEDRVRPVRVELAGALEIAAGGSTTCARTGDGRVACWGASGASSGEAPASSARVVAGVDDTIDIDVGGSHACAVRIDGRVACWGANDHGQLGDGTRIARSEAADVPGSIDMIGVRAGDAHTCAIDALTHAICWGANEHGQLGDGTSEDRLAPAARHSSVVAMGGDHTCGRVTWGEVACWGEGYGSAPVMIENLAEASVVAIGSEHGSAVHLIGVPRSWGANRFGQLGDGTTRDAEIPVDAIAPRL